MGYLNAELIREANRVAMALGTQHPAFAMACALVDQSQEACGHPEKDRATTLPLPKGSPSGKYRAGDRLYYCRACSKVLGIR